MEPRLEGVMNPELRTAIHHFHKAIHAGGVDRRLLPAPA